MSPRSRRPVASQPGYLSLVVLLFAGSGCAALIYQIVWLQLLSLVIGSSAISLGVLLGTFMAGMAVGSLVLAPFVSRQHHPLRVFAALELGIGSAGLLVMHALPWVDVMYANTGGGVLVRALVAAACLLPPTILMGATLPAVARAVAPTPRGLAWLGRLYGGNIAGAVVGVLLTGFYLLPRFDMAVATYAALSVNLLVSMTALGLSHRTYFGPAPQTAPDDQGTAHGAQAVRVYVAIALSGFTALAAEVVWTRLLSLAVGATVYAFSLILAAFLAGLGLGSSIGAGLVRRSAQPRVLLGWVQALSALAIAWAAYRLTESLPYLPLPVSATSRGTLLVDLARCVSVVLPGALLWGASLPLALAAAAAPGRDPARLVGGIYAANTLGAIAGSTGGVWMAGTIGSAHAQQVMMLAAMSSAAILLAPAMRASSWSKRRLWPATAMLVAFAVAGLLAWRVAPVPGVLVAYGRNSASWAAVSNVIYSGEGLNAFVAVSRAPSGAPIFHAAGKVQASSEGEDLRLQRMLAHFSHLMVERPKEVLVIGLGAGTTAGAIAIAPAVERVTVVEIERLVPPLSPLFADYNYRVAESPKVTVRIDDGRHALMTSRATFDVITSDLIDPWVKGAAALFTRELFEMMRKRLNPGGVVTLFVQLYMSNEATVKSEIGTFMEVFPDALVWGNTRDGEGYDLVLTGRREPAGIDIDAWQARLERRDHASVAASLREVGFGSAADLLSTYAGSREDLQPWLADAVINRDGNLRLQYLAGTSATLQQNGPIYASMVRHLRFPTGLFRGSTASVQAVRQGVERAWARSAQGEGRRR